MQHRHIAIRPISSGIRLTLCIALVLGVSACKQHPSTPVTAPTGNWVQLFNGKDLDDWTVKIAGHDVNDNFGDTFRVENGLLKVSYDRYKNFGRQFGSLFYKSKFSHYWLRAEYRFVGNLAPGAPSWAYKDSGIQLHCQSPSGMSRDQEFPVSVEFNLIGGRFLSRPTGDVCRNGTRLTIGGKFLDKKCSALSDITIRGDAWVTALAEVEGGARIRQIVNGIQIVEYSNVQLDDVDADAAKLLAAGTPAALDAGYISIQSNGFPIEFRKIELLPLDDSR